LRRPAIGKEFHAQISGLQWVSAGYLLTVAGLILLAGALTDRYGRRRIFVIGVTWFAIASLICAIAPQHRPADRGTSLQGVGGALLTRKPRHLEASFAPRSAAAPSGPGRGSAASPRHWGRLSAGF